MAEDQDDRTIQDPPTDGEAKAMFAAAGEGDPPAGSGGDGTTASAPTTEAGTGEGDPPAGSGGMIKPKPGGTTSTSTSETTASDTKPTEN